MTSGKSQAFDGEWPMAEAREQIRVSELARAGRVLFWPLMLFLILEYVRPPLIVQLRLQMLLTLFFVLFWAMRSDWTWSRNLTLQLAFLLLSAASVVYASNYFSAYVITRTLFGHLAIAIVITWILSERALFVRLVWAWIGIISYQALFAITHGGVGTGGFLRDENDLALACVTALPFALVGLLGLRGWRRWVSGGFAVLFTAALVASASRGGFVGFVVAALYCLIAAPRRGRNLAIAAVAALLFVALIPSSYKEEIRSIRDTSSGTSETRRFLWQAAVNMWLDHPVLGVGAGNYNWNVGKYQPSGQSSGLFSGAQYHERDFTMSATHSSYFQVLSEGGGVGVLLFGAIVFGHFARLRKLRRWAHKSRELPEEVRSETELYALALAGAMVGYLGAAAFVSVAYYPYPWYLSALAVAWERASRAGAPTSVERDVSAADARSAA